MNQKPSYSKGFGYDLSNTSVWILSGASKNPCTWRTEIGVGHQTAKRSHQEVSVGDTIVMAR